MTETKHARLNLCVQRIGQILPPVNTAETLFHGTSANLGMSFTAALSWACKTADPGKSHVLV